jgi:two-component system OmpR family response regulator
MTPAAAISSPSTVRRRNESMKILLVEDDANLAHQVSSALKGAGYVVDRADDGEEGHYRGEVNEYDAVVLDLGLPKIDGIEVLKRWRREGRAMPVLILTARDRWSEKVAGFDVGADDYLGKPFHMEELLARLRALIRRHGGQSSAVLHSGPISLDTRTSIVQCNGKAVGLTAFEYRLLRYMMHRAGQVVSRAEIVEHIYEQDFDRDSNTVEVFVGRLRRKLTPDAIETVRGQGYRMPAGANLGAGAK